MIRLRLFHRLDRVVFWLGMVPLLVLRWWANLRADPSIGYFQRGGYFPATAAVHAWLAAEAPPPCPATTCLPGPLHMPSAGPGERVPR